MSYFGFNNVVSSCAAAFIEAGVGTEDARITAQSLVLADARGLHSHGVTRLSQYIKRLHEDRMDPSCRVSVLRERSSSLLLDGNNGLGIPVGIKAMDLVAEKAAESGIAFAVVRRSNHFGMAGFIAERANSHGLIGYAASNGPARMAAYGGKSPVFGTNPFAFAVPSSVGKPILVDMSTSVVARGKIQLAAKAGTSIPEGWAVDSDGVSTIDADRALEGAVLPFGGPKGSAIAMMIDIMSGVLGGQRWGKKISDHHLDSSRETGIGHSIAAIDIEAFGEVGNFAENMSDFVRQIQSETDGDEGSVYLPGERERIDENLSLEHGVWLPEDVVQEVNGLLMTLNVPTLIEDARRSRESEV